MRVLRRSVGVCIGLMLLWTLIPVTRPVLADGGAPNLAYIAGSKTGISVIDIPQQKVTTSFHLTGDPRTIYLSLDGRFLYVSQPALGRIAMLVAKIGQIICNVNVPGRPSLLAFDPYSIPQQVTASQQVSTRGTGINVLAYALVLALLIAAIVFIARRARTTYARKK